MATSTPPRLDEPARRLAEIVRGDTEPHIYNTWHESVPLSATDRHLLRCWTALTTGMP